MIHANEGKVCECVGSDFKLLSYWGGGGADIK